MSLDFSTLEGFGWDSANLKHIKKHDVDYRECEEAIFNKPFLVNKDDVHSHVEERYQALGKSNEERLLFLVFTMRKSSIRIVSARDQNKKERKKYQGIGGDTT